MKAKRKRISNNLESIEITDNVKKIEIFISENEDGLKNIYVYGAKELIDIKKQFVFTYCKSNKLFNSEQFNTNFESYNKEEVISIYKKETNQNPIKIERTKFDDNVTYKIKDNANTIFIKIKEENSLCSSIELSGECSIYVDQIGYYRSILHHVKNLFSKDIYSFIRKYGTTFNMSLDNNYLEVTLNTENLKHKPILIIDKSFITNSSSLILQVESIKESEINELKENTANLTDLNSYKKEVSQSIVDFKRHIHDLGFFFDYSYEQHNSPLTWANIKIEPHSLTIKKAESLMNSYNSHTKIIKKYLT